MTEGVLNNLDTISRSFVLALPAPVAADDTTFNHVFFGWNPAGHPPPGINTVPHFDFHFVTVRRSEREAVIPGPDSILLPQYTPTDYSYDPNGAIPFHGTHWADSTVHGLLIKRLIYGFYRGKIFFYEPMVTRAFLLTNPQDLLIIKQPQNYWRTGRFPTKYSITHNASNQTYNVVLRDFIDIPLPVELSSFVSLVIGGNVKLNWTTSSEDNNSGFEVQRSIINGEWSVVNFVRGIGNSNSPQNYSYEDRNLPSRKYKYRLKQIDYNGNFRYYDLQNEVVIGIPEKFSLSQNYPNPFNPATVIRYSLIENRFTTLKIYDINGKEVATLVNQIQNAGYYAIDFDGSKLASGQYFYKLQAGNFSQVKRMILLK